MLSSHMSSRLRRLRRCTPCFGAQVHSKTTYNVSQHMMPLSGQAMERTCRTVKAKAKKSAHTARGSTRPTPSQSCTASHPYHSKTSADHVAPTQRRSWCLQGQFVGVRKGTRHLDRRLLRIAGMPVLAMRAPCISIREHGSCARPAAAHSIVSCKRRNAHGRAVPRRRRANEQRVLRGEQHGQGGQHARAPDQAPGRRRRGHAGRDHGQVEQRERVCGAEGRQQQRRHVDVQAPVLQGVRQGNVTLAAPCYCSGTKDIMKTHGCCRVFAVQAATLPGS